MCRLPQQVLLPATPKATRTIEPSPGAVCQGGQTLAAGAIADDRRDFRWCETRDLSRTTANTSHRQRWHRRRGFDPSSETQRGRTPPSSLLRGHRQQYQWGLAAATDPRRVTDPRRETNPSEIDLPPGIGLSPCILATGLGSVFRLGLITPPPGIGLPWDRA